MKRLIYLILIFSLNSYSQTKEIMLSFCIDGISSLHIKKGKFWWEHHLFDPPGVSPDCPCLNLIDTIKWLRWKDTIDYKIQTDSLVSFEVVKYRHKYNLKQKPTLTNEFETIIFFDDGPPGGSFNYKVKLSFYKEDTSIIRLNGVFFDFNSSIIKPGAYRILDSAITQIKSRDLITEISGHTDDKGKNDFNLKLSTERAKAVYEYFLQKGIKKEKMSFKGYGASKPLLSNETEAGRLKNRRVEIKTFSK